MLECTCIIKRWDCSHSGCEVFCCIQRKVDADDADYKFKSIWKANKNIWRPCLLAIIGRWIATTTNLFYGSPHSPLAHGCLGNFLILVALHKVSSLHPPSKLLYRCLATTDQLSIVSQPFKERFLCRFTYKATYTTAYSLCSVPLLTMAAISVGRFLALLSGLRYRQIQCNFRAHVLHGSNLLGTVWRRWFMLLDYRIDT